MMASYRFGCVEVRPAERQLLIDRAQAKVGAHAFDVLRQLIERHDRVVSNNGRKPRRRFSAHTLRRCRRCSGAITISRPCGRSSAPMRW